MKRAYLKKKSDSPTALAKDRIQALCRAISIKRDGGCVLRDYSETGKCGGCRNDGELVLQFDHLNTRSRNVSYGDPRCGVCVCKRHHLFYKRQFPFEYEKAVMDSIGKKRRDLVYRVRADKKDYNMVLNDWLKIEMALIQELQKYDS